MSFVAIANVQNKENKEEKEGISHSQCIVREAAPKTKIKRHFIIIP